MAKLQIEHSLEKEKGMSKVKEIIEELGSVIHAAEEENLLALIRKEDELCELAESAKLQSFKIKYLAIRHLGDSGLTCVIPHLIAFLTDENAILSAEAGRAIEKIESEDKFDYLLPLLESSHPATSLYAIKSLGRGERINAVLPLLEIIGHDNGLIRYHVIDALRLIGDARADWHVIKHLDDLDPLVRYAAAFYCGSRKVKSSVNKLIALLKDSHTKIRHISAWALGQMRGDTGIRSLITLLDKEPNKDVGNEIFRILYRKGKLHRLRREGESGVCFEAGGHSKCVSEWYLSHIIKAKKPKGADICLFVEGSYPFVSGGVSSWIRDLLDYFKDLTFSIVHVATSSSDIREFKFEMPANVLYLQEINIYDVPEHKNRREKNKKKLREWLSAIFNFIENIDGAGEKDFSLLCQTLGIPDNFELELEDLLFSREAWEFTTSLYARYVSDLPFLEYSWSLRSIILPIYNVMKAKFPPGRINYTALTGYAGLAAVLSKITSGAPLMLTEHGIYHRERMLEINRSGWIYEKEEDGYIARDIFSGLKKIWIRLYLAISEITYRVADRITTLYVDNASMQAEAGADKSRIALIPNGIDFEEYESVREGKIVEAPFTVALVGRVAGIKDIKTFVRAARILQDKWEGRINFKVMGPYDEEKEYADDCFAFASLLGLTDLFTFTGNVDLRKALREVDVIVFTSLSEGQPLALMEAMAAGIPGVTSNVGACKELLYGKNDEDRQLGRCGIITGVRSPHETAHAIATILKDPKLYREMSKAGQERISRYYRKKDVFELYRKEFNNLFNGT